MNASALAPGNIDTWINLGITKLRRGEIAAAKELFAKALKLKPDDARADYYAAMALKAEGDYGAALAHVKEASAVVRRDREFHMELGRLHILLDHLRYSKEAYKRVIHIDPEDPVIYQDLIRTYKTEANKQASIARAEPLLRRFDKDERMRALERQARLQAAWPDTSSEFYYEYRSADPGFWPAEAASNGHVISRPAQNMRRAH